VSNIWNYRVSKTEPTNVKLVKLFSQRSINKELGKIQCMTVNIHLLTSLYQHVTIVDRSNL